MPNTHETGLLLLPFILRQLTPQYFIFHVFKIGRCFPLRFADNTEVLYNIPVFLFCWGCWLHFWLICLHWHFKAKEEYGHWMLPICQTYLHMICLIKRKAPRTSCENWYEVVEVGRRKLKANSNFSRFHRALDRPPD